MRSGMNRITIDVDTLQHELEAQELYLDEAQWLSIVDALRKAEV